MPRHLSGLIVAVAVSGSLFLGGDNLHSGFRAGNSPSPANSLGERRANPLGLQAVATPPTHVNARFQLPVFFDRNVGQSDPSVLYTAHGLTYSFFLTRTGATIVLPGAYSHDHGGTLPGARTLRLSFKDANPRALVEGMEELQGKSNYFSGSDPKSWHTQVPQYRKVRYRELYPGVDVIFYSRNGQLEYDIVAGPGADLSVVHLQATGGRTALTVQGDAALQLGSSRFLLKRPRVYQGDADRQEIPAGYSLRGNDLSFLLAKYDYNRSIVIDPALSFSTYLNSNCETVNTHGTFPCAEGVTDIAADASGSYITGYTDASSFPATSGAPAPTPTNGPFSTFILKLNPAGTDILYAAYLSDSQATSIAIDTLGSAFVSGTANTPSNFPLTSGVFSGTMPATSYAYDVPFVTKLSASGVILYSTLLQQPTPNATTVQNPQQIAPVKIAVDSQGALYVTGFASSNSASIPSIWMPLPVTQGAFQTTPGTLFALKLSTTFSGLTYSTYIDGTQGSGGNTIGPGAGISASGIAVDSNGDAFVSGTAQATFPTTPGSYEPTLTSGGGFVMELNPSGSAPVYSTFFPGQINGLAIDSQGQAVIVGGAVGGLPLPVTSNAFCSTASGFTAKLNATGSALIYSTSLCGSFSGGGGVAVDSIGAAYITGWTFYPATFQPVLLQPIKSYFTTFGGSPAVTQLALKLDTNGNLLWSTFLGDSENVTVSRIAIDPSGAAYILYASASFPTTPGTVGLRDQGISQVLSGDDFFLKIAPSLGLPVGLAVPDSVTFPSQNVNTSSAAVDVAVGNYGDAPMSATVSISGDFSETDTCSTAVAPGQKCDVNVVFTPTATGSRTGSLSLTVGGNVGSETIPLSGTGTAAALGIAPTSLSFGTQSVGTTSLGQQVTLTNTGTGPLTIASIQTTSQFNATNTCGSPITPAGSCTVQVTFTPTASGSQNGTLTITDNAPNSPQQVALAGNQPATFSMSPASGSSMSATVNAGQTANYSLGLAGANGFSGTVNLTCTGAPTGAACSVNPNTATINGSSAVPVAVNVLTTAASVALPSVWNLHRSPFSDLHLLGTSVLVFGLFSCYGLARRQLSSWKRVPALSVLLLISVIVVSCGGGNTSSSQPPSQPATPSGQYVLTVTGTSGSVTQTVKLNLSVN